MTFRFEDYEVDTAAMELRQAGRRVSLEPQVFDVLAYLVKHADRVVSKDELLDNVWGDRYISESAVSSRIMAARKAIGDDGKAQRLIRTVHGRGFRFCAESATGEARSTVSVGRQDELALMRYLLGESRSGHRSNVFVCGIAGAGKTTLVRDFLIEASADCYVIWALCNAHSAESEPFCPLLMSVSDLATRSPEDGIEDVVRKHAPSWSERIGWMAVARPADARPTLREFIELVEALALRKPVVVAVDDLHWADTSTLEAIVYLMRRQSEARIMVVGTARLDEDSVPGRAAAKSIGELTLRGETRTIDLPSLGREAVEELLRRRFDDVDDELIGAVHRRTGGHPLFLVAAIEQIVAGGRESLSELPADVRQFVEMQYAELSAADKDIVGSAACVGRDFCSMAVAAMLEADPAENEDRCLELGRTGRFFVRNGNEKVGKGEVYAAFKFRHDIVFEVVHELLPPAKRAKWHRLFAEWSSDAFDWEIERRAYGLSRHYRAANDWENCVKWLAFAANVARKQGREQDAVRIAEEGLETVAQTGRGETYIADLHAFTSAHTD